MNWQNQTNYQGLGISYVTYTLICKYLCGTRCIEAVYKALLKGYSFHFLLDKEGLQRCIEKEEVGMLFNKVKLPYKNVDIKDLKPKKSPEFTEFMTEILPKIKNESVVINFYSKVGDQAQQAVCYCVEELMKDKVSITVTSGMEINRLSVDFKSDISLLTKDILVINCVNSVNGTDWKQEFLDNLFLEAKLNNIPVITSGVSPLKIEECNVLNFELVDAAKSQAQILKKLKEK